MFWKHLLSIRWSAASDSSDCIWLLIDFNIIIFLFAWDIEIKRTKMMGICLLLVKTATSKYKLGTHFTLSMVMWKKSCARNRYVSKYVLDRFKAFYKLPTSSLKKLHTLAHLDLDCGCILRYEGSEILSCQKHSSIG